MTLTDFFFMGGFGIYIWASFTATLLMAVIEIMILKQQRKNNLTRLRRLQSMQCAQPGE